MTLVLQWRVPDPSFSLRWRGNAGVMASIAANPMQSLAGYIVPPSGSVRFVHTQSQPSSIWTIAHNLGFEPSVTVYDAEGDLIYGDVTSDNDNQITITFTTPVSGKARLT